MDATMQAQEFTEELLQWQKDKDPIASVPALLVAAAKVAAFSAEGEQRLAHMLRLLTVAFTEEREKYEVSLHGH